MSQKVVSPKEKKEKREKREKIAWLCMISGAVGMIAMLAIMKICIDTEIGSVFFSDTKGSVPTYALGVITFLVVTIVCYLIISRIQIPKNERGKQIGIAMCGVTVALILGLIYGLLKADDGYSGADVSSFYWHTHSTLLIALIFTIVGAGATVLVYLEAKRKNLVNAKNKWYIFGIIYLILAIAYAFTAVYLNVFAADVYHINAYLHPIYSIYYNMPYSASSYSIYGHYELFYKIPMMIFGTSPVVICVELAVVGVITALAIFLSVHMLTNSNVIRIGACFALLVPTGCMFMTSSYQTTPHRNFFPMILVCLSIYIAKYKKELTFKYKVIATILCCLAVLWNTESGLFCVIGWLVYRFIWYFQLNKFKILECIKLIAILGVEAIVEVLGAIIIVNIYNLFVGGGLFTKEFFYPYLNSSFMQHYVILIKFANMPYLYIMILALAALTFGVSKTTLFRGRNKDFRAAAVGSCGVILLGQLSYYISRAAYYGLLITVPAVIVLSAFVADAAYTGIKRIRADKNCGLYSWSKVSVGMIAITAIFTMCCMGVKLGTSYVSLYKEGRYTTSGIKTEAQKIVDVVEPNTYALGWGVDEWYGVLGWDTGYHMVGTTDVLLDKEANAMVFSKLQEELGQQERLFLSEVAYTSSSAVTSDFAMTDQLNLYGKNYGYFTKKNYMKAQILSEFSSGLQMEYYVDSISDCGDFYNIIGWAFDQNTKQADGSVQLGLLNPTTGELITIDTQSVMRKDVNDAYGDSNHDYSNSGIYGRIMKSEIDANISYQVVLVQKQDGAYATQITEDSLQ